MKRFAYEAKKTVLSRFMLLIFLILTAANLVYGFLVPANGKIVSADSHFTALDDAVYGAEITLELIEDKSSERGLYQQAIIDLYTPLFEATVREVRGFGTVLHAVLPSFCAFAFMLFLVLRDVSGEFTAGTLFLSYRKKRVGIGAEKLMLYLLLPFVLTAFFMLCLSLGVGVREGFSGLFAPVGSLASYLYCPYDITVAGALLLRLALCGLGIAAFSLLFAVFTLALRRFLSALLAAIGVIGLDVIFGILSSDAEFSFFKCIGLAPLLTDAPLVRLNGLKWGVFLSGRTLAFLVLPIVIAALSAVFLILLRRVCYGRTVRSKKGREMGARSGTRLLRYEMKKLVTLRSVLALMLLLAVFLTLHLLRTEKPFAAYDAQYKEYLTVMGEMDYEGQIAFVDREYRENSLFVAEAERLKNDYYDGKIPHAEYMDVSQRAGVSELKVSVLKELKGKLPALAEFRERGFDAALSYSLGFEKLFATGLSPLLPLALVLVMVPFASVDADSGFAVMQKGYDINRRSERRKKEKRRLFVMLLAGVCITALFLAAEIAFFGIAIGLPSWSAYAVTVPARYIGHRYVGLILLRFLSMTVFAAFVLAVTAVLGRRIKKTVPLLLAVLGCAAALWLLAKACSLFG